MKRSVFLFQPYFDRGGSEKTTISWALQFKKMGVRPVLVTFANSKAGRVAAENNLVHMELQADSVRRSLFPLVKLFRAHVSDGDIFVGVQPYSSYWFIFLSIIFSKVKWVISFRNHPSELRLDAGRSGKLIYRLLPLLLKSADAITANSLETLADLRSCQQKARYFYVRNSVKPSDLCREDRTKAPHRLIFIGRLCSQKRPFLALEILELLSRTLQVRLDFYGDGELLHTLKERAEQEGLPAVFQGHKEITPKVLVQYDLLLVTSEYEGFPNVMLEAGSVALPVASVNFRSGASELLHPDRGLLLSNDVQAAADEMELLLRNGSYMTAQGLRLFKYVCENHSDVMQFSDLQDLLDAL